MRRKRVVAGERPSQAAIGAITAFHAEGSSGGSFHWDHHRVGGGDQGRPVMNQQVVAGVLRIEIDRRLPADAGEVLPGHR